MSAVNRREFAAMLTALGPGSDQPVPGGAKAGTPGRMGLARNGWGPNNEVLSAALYHSAFDTGRAIPALASVRVDLASPCIALRHPQRFLRCDAKIALSLIAA